MHLGTAFQLIDDVLDYSGDRAQTGKNLGDDLAEGKPTLPLIHAMRNGNAGAGRADPQGDHRGRAERFRARSCRRSSETGALDYARQQAEDAAQRARAAIAGLLPHSKYRECLLELAAFAVTRNY